MKRIITVLFVACVLALAVPQFAFADEDSKSGSAAPALTSSKAGVSSTSSQALVDALAGKIFTIVPSNRTTAALEVANRSTANGGATQVAGANYSAAQRWRFIHLGGGWFRLVNVWSGKVLDVSEGRKVAGTSVQQYEWNKSAAQKWKVSTTTGGFVITSALSDNLVLDLRGGKTANGTGIVVNKAKNTKSQTWKLGKVGSTLQNGYYYFANINSGKRLTVASASTANTANIEQRAENDKLSQVFRITYDAKTGYYKLCAAISGRMVSVQYGSAESGANVRQFDSNSHCAQKWAIIKNADGSFTLRNAISGKALDVAGASTKNGANVRVFNSNGTAAQKWNAGKLTSWIPEGAYFVRSKITTGTRLAVKDQSRKIGANVQMNSKATVNNQRWYFRPMGSGYYAIQNVNSGKYLNAVSTASGANIVQSNYPGKYWKPVLTAKGIVFKLVGNQKVVLNVSGGSANSGANIQVATYNKSNAQNYLLTHTAILANGVYSISSAVNNKFLFDTAGASKTAGLALQVYTKNGTNAQKFRLKHLGSNKYRITSVASGLSLQADGTRIVQEKTASLQSQQWKPVLDYNTGNVSFQSVAEPNRSMTLNTAKPKNKTKVKLRKNSTSTKQDWILTPVASSSKAGKTRYDKLGITMAQLAAIEGSSIYYVNPANGNKYKFLDLRGYTGTTAAQLDKALQAIAPWIGPGNPLYKSGKYFVEAAKKHNINEVFLLAQAGGETGWGTSYGGPGGYNFFGVDGGAGTAAALYNNAAIRGWTTIEKGIVGGAKFLADEWVYRKTYPQYSPYLLRYDYFYANKNKSYSWHHYTTADGWPDTLAGTIEKLYTKAGTSKKASFVKPKFKQ